eukprot:3636170-Pleurochrysis_carterae.AAC.3
MRGDTRESRRRTARISWRGGRCRCSRGGRSSGGCARRRRRRGTSSASSCVSTARARTAGTPQQAHRRVCARVRERQTARRRGEGKRRDQESNAVGSCY